MNRLDLIPEAIRETIETAFVWAKAEVLAPGAGFVATAVVQYLLGRQEAARGILRSELERAGASVADFKDVDQLAAAAVRYHRAARDQAADANLRILAQAMIGLARRDELWASDFLKYADILSPLNRDELVLLVKIMEADRQLPPSDIFMEEELARVWQPVMRDSISIFGSGYTHAALR